MVFAICLGKVVPWLLLKIIVRRYKKNIEQYLQVVYSGIIASLKIPVDDLS
jgi:hypothetical protein